jgi:hypothetical protein
MLYLNYYESNDILHALQSTISNCHDKTQNELFKIYRAMKAGDEYDIQYAFLDLEEKYSNRHMTLFLELIWNAELYENIYKDTVDRNMFLTQFENAADEINKYTNRKRELTSVINVYIIIILFLIPSLFIVGRLIFQKPIFENNILFHTIFYSLTAVVSILAMRYFERIE